MDDLRIAVVGCGSIGRRHIRNLRALGVPVTAIDRDPAAARAAEELGATAADSLAATEDVSAVLVCTPATDHMTTSSEALDRGFDVFIEKPLAATLTDGRALQARVDRSDRIVAVGYNLRHEAGIAALRSALSREAVGRLIYARIEFGQYLPDWRPQRDYRETVTARADRGGGILLEASHDIDAIEWLFGPWRSVTAVVRRLSSLEIDVEDTASAIVETRDGYLVELHLDLVRRGYTHSIVCVGSEGTLKWGLLTGTSITRADGSIGTLSQPEELNAMYLAEMRAFVSALRVRSNTLPSVHDGVRVLELIDAIRTASASATVRSR